MAIGFFVGIIVGANLGLVVFSLLKYAKSK